MAECALAVSFAPLEGGVRSDRIDFETLARDGEARAAGPLLRAKTRAFVNCGAPLPGYEVEIRDEWGDVLAERRCGRIYLRGPSLMAGYFANKEATREVLSSDGWLDTGDLGYSVDGNLYLTGRAKDLMIIKGRNIWPQDLEHLAEQHPEVRPTDSSAFSITDDDDNEMAVLVVQCRETDRAELAALAERLRQEIHAEFGIQCLIELVLPHTLPRTSSGKLSRSSARKEFVERRRKDDDGKSPTCFISEGKMAGPHRQGRGSGGLSDGLRNSR
jgi:fatty-acyl-CoA synthase